MIMKYNHGSDRWTDTDDYEKIFDRAAADTRTPWLPQPPVPDTEESEARGMPEEDPLPSLDAKIVAQKRKEQPLYSGVLRYFPDALLAIAELSFIGNEQHNPGTPVHWDRSKSEDELDSLMRHLVDAGTLDTDGVRHSTKVAWRALAALQKEIERGV